MQNIQQTEDYHLFKRIKGNRPIKSSHVNRLFNSISHNPDLIKSNPIIVNKDMEIIDGQHRLEAIKKLGLPVYYVEGNGLGLSEVQALNASVKSWNMVDYAKSYAELGNKHYKVYLEFLSKYKLGKTVIADYLSLDKHCTKEAFVDGKFKTVDVEKSQKLCEALLDIGRFHGNFNTKPFSTAFKKVWQNKDYNHKRMLERMEKYASTIENYRIQEDYVRAMERIYNKNMMENQRVRFF